MDTNTHPKARQNIKESEIINALLGRSIPCKIIFPDASEIEIGNESPKFTATFKTSDSLLLPLSELAIGKSYIDGEIDIDGDFYEVMRLRDELSFGTTMKQKLEFLYNLFIKSPTKSNKDAISSHYDLGDDFYLTFLDKDYHFYSHCLFDNDDESLEEAAEHKLESMWKALNLEPGMSLLDIGGGWGAVAEYCSPRGVKVTSVTLADDSAKHIQKKIDEKSLNAEVIHSDFLELETSRKFDHVVIYGVIEHIPNYALFSEKVWDLLRPGGRLYLDASATTEKFAISPITRQFTWPGHHSFFSLADMIREQLLHGFEVLEAKRETRDYELTITRWAERFEANREYLIDRWGERNYRIFRIFLWGGAHAFHTNRLQAYHLVTQKLDSPGLRPGLVHRVSNFISTLVR
ncbi:class I SAM-dependent methyltransferase [Corynebacterium sp.]|uniref:class I SAM-dependent methyltransferase n=1 Tax=Corynebacterium sp. TaxID=1720 RepID=UPI0028A83E14|nr:class I SAM-dependent methyltransferase [Corynebacterium sp.]